MQKEKIKTNQKAILNSIQDLQRLSYSLSNNIRGRFQIKFAMTPSLNKRGFTLIELLVVVLIISILAAIALPQYQFAVARSRFVQAKVLATSLAEAEELYYLTNGKYTNNFDNLAVNIGGETTEFLKEFRYFNWGNCRLDAHEYGRAETSCQIMVPAGRVSYWISFAHSTYSSNRRACFASGETGKPNTTDISYRICEQDTNNPSSRVIFGANTYAWYYK